MTEQSGSDDVRRIAILGSGLMGAALGRLWAARGHAVAFSYSRDPRKLERLARESGPAARVVAAFNTVPSELLHESVLGTADARPEVVICGDDDEAKTVAGRLVLDAGCDPVDAGPLRVARYTEPFGLLVAELAYNRGLGPALGYRFVRAEAEEGE